MKNESMTNEQKKELINFNAPIAFNKFITADNHQMWSAITIATNNTTIAITGCYTTPNAIIASKNAMLVMLELGLI